MCILYTSDQYHITGNLAVIFPADKQQAHFCTDKARQIVYVSISSFLLPVFLFPNQPLITDEHQEVRTF